MLLLYFAWQISMSLLSFCSIFFLSLSPCLRPSQSFIFIRHLASLSLSLLELFQRQRWDFLLPPQEILRYSPPADIYIRRCSYNDYSYSGRAAVKWAWRWVQGLADWFARGIEDKTVLSLSLSLAGVRNYCYLPPLLSIPWCDAACKACTLPCTSRVGGLASCHSVCGSWRLPTDILA